MTENVELKREIKQRFAEIPHYDPNQAPVFDINAIKELLPHRSPFLMVDRITEIGEDFVVGCKMIGINEPFFVGHFPDEPVVPGVLLVEAMGQVGGILALKDLDEPHKYSTYFLRINNVRFRHKVVPGDVVLFKLIVTQPLEHSILGMSGRAWVGDTLVCEGDMVAQLIKNKE